MQNKLLVYRWNPTVIFSMEIKLMAYKNLSKWTGNGGECTEEFSLNACGVKHGGIGFEVQTGDGWVGLTLGLSPGIAEGRFNFESKREPSQAQMGPRNSWEAATSKHGMNAWPSGLLPPGAGSVSLGVSGRGGCKPALKAKN